MTVFPRFEDFKAGYEKGRPSVVWTTLVADLDTPGLERVWLGAGAPVDFRLVAICTPQKVGLEADDRIAAAHGATLDGLE